MSKALEALDRLWKNCKDYHNDNGNLHDDFWLAKSAIERKEKLEKVWNVFKKNEYIKNVLQVVDDFENYELYVECCQADDVKPLTKTEFNLLKEMPK